MTDERIKELSVAELDEISLGESVDMLRTPDRISMLAFRMSEEIRRRRAEAVAMRPVVEAARELVSCEWTRLLGCLDRLLDCLERGDGGATQGP